MSDQLDQAQKINELEASIRHKNLIASQQANQLRIEQLQNGQKELVYSCEDCGDDVEMERIQLGLIDVCAECAKYRETGK